LELKNQVGKKMKSVHFLVSSIKNSLDRQKLITSVPYSKINMQILELLFQDGYIIGYTRDIENPSLIIIKLRFTLGNYLKNLKFYNSNSVARHLSKEGVKNLSSKVRFGIITSSSSQLINLSQAKKMRTGGQVLFTF
jgi:ribosomal protein S8